MTLLGLPAAQLLPAFAAGAGALTVLYLLKQRRRRVAVPFARLWQRVLKESESTALQRRLKRWLSLLLQLVLLALLVLSLGDPRLSQSQAGRTLVLLVDTSASMQAFARPPYAAPSETRLAEARRQAQRLIRGLSGDDLAVVVALSGEPSPLGGLTQDEPELLAQVDALRPRDEPADLPRALHLCADILAGRQNPQVVLISDGGLDDEGQAALAGAAADKAFALRFQPLPLPPPTLANLAITSFAVRRYRQNRLSYEVLVEVASFPPLAASASDVARPDAFTLELVQEGEVVDVQRLRLRPGERVQRVYQNLAGSGAHLIARLKREGGPDPLPLDDQAYALLPERRRQRALLVTRGNLFLEGALLSSGAGADGELQVDRVAPEAYERLDEARLAAFDAVIFDAYTPKAPPDANALYLDPQGEGSPFAIAETLAAPLATDVAKDHPLLRWVTLKDLNISRASVFRLEPGEVAIAAMLRKPFIAARERPARPGGPPRRVVALGFDLRRSDLPLRVAFPVLLLNAVDWFIGEGAEDPQSYATGRTWRVPLPRSQRSGPNNRGDNSVKVDSLRRSELTLPDGRVVAVPIYESHALHHGAQVGFYSLSRPGQRPLPLAGALRSEVESAAALRAELRISDRRAEAAPAISASSGATSLLLPAPEPSRAAIKRALWPYLLLAALLLLLLEWGTYHRRWTV